MITELKTFLAAVSFFTRIPVPHRFVSDGRFLSGSLRQLPVVGWIVGAAAALIVAGIGQLYPQPLVVIVATGVTLLLTGAIHEDGWIDFCDGFGGGTDRESILRIMKDPRAGSFGTIGIALLLLFKIATSSSIPLSYLPSTLLLSHTLSRATLLIPVLLLGYARSDDSKSAGMIQRPGAVSLVFAFAVGIAPLYFFDSVLFWTVPVAALIFAFVFSLYLAKRLGGYTGDCLGALQQLEEALVLFLILTLERTVLS